MNVVSNASPLISLSRVGHLHLLNQIYTNIVIPEAVWYEVVVQGKGQVGTNDVQIANWIQKQAIRNKVLAHTLQRDLDAGEAEAIVLGLEIGADALLMDERLGRETAAYLGLRCIGVIGVLIAAKNRGVVQSIKPLLDALRDVARFRVSSTLYHKVLHDAGEE